MRRIRKFVRDVELHVHHKNCPCYLTEDSHGHLAPLACVCTELDADDERMRFDYLREKEEEVGI